MIMECEVWIGFGLGLGLGLGTPTQYVVHIRMDHKILHLVCIEAEGDIFRHPIHTCNVFMGSRKAATATGIFPALRLVHSLLKYFFKFRL